MTAVIAMPAPGQAIGVLNSMRTHYVPFVFGHEEPGYVVVNPIQEGQPITVFPLAVFAWVPAADTSFRFACVTCSRSGRIARWLRNKIAGPAEDELRGALVRGEDQVECPVCDGERFVVWDPFTPRHTCAQPARYIKVRA